jgi:P27 family predicted phage terminase small subunit
LSGAAKREWRRIAPELERLGLLTLVDRAALAAYCEAWARWRQAELKLKEMGLVVRNSKMTGWMKNPWLLVADKAMEQIRAFASEFGLTPAARTRIQVPKGETEDDWPELD